MNPVENKLKMLMLMFMLQIVMTSVLVWGVTPCTRDLEWYTHTHTRPQWGAALQVRLLAVIGWDLHSHTSCCVR